MQRAHLFLTGLLAVAVSLPAGASTFVAMDEEALLSKADAVVRGKVVSVDSFWNDRHTLIITEAILEVEKAIVGQTPPFLTLRTAGGTVDDYTVEAIGFPSFLVGERALVFLQRDDDKPLGKVSIGGRPEGYRITGYQLGHYRILQDRRGREIAVPTADPGVSLVTRDGSRPQRPRAQRLEAFEDHLRGLARELGLAVADR